jgi:hypothetical protein
MGGYGIKKADSLFESAYCKERRGMKACFCRQEGFLRRPFLDIAHKFFK